MGHSVSGAAAPLSPKPASRAAPPAPPARRASARDALDAAQLACHVRAAVAGGGLHSRSASDPASTSSLLGTRSSSAPPPGTFSLLADTAAGGRAAAAAAAAACGGLSRVDSAPSLSNSARGGRSGRGSLSDPSAAEAPDSHFALAPADSNDLPANLTRTSRAASLTAVPGGLARAVAAARALLSAPPSSAAAPPRDAAKAGSNAASPADMLMASVPGRCALAFARLDPNPVPQAQGALAPAGAGASELSCVPGDASSMADDDEFADAMSGAARRSRDRDRAAMSDSISALPAALWGSLGVSTQGTAGGAGGGLDGGASLGESSANTAAAAAAAAPPRVASPHVHF